MKMTFEELESEFEKRIRKLNPTSVLDMAEINQKSAEILGEIVSENVFNFYNIEAVCKGIQRRYCDKMNETNSALQKKYDEKNGLQITPQKADFPTERVTQIAESLTDTTVPPETIQRRARNAIENVANSFHDDYVRKNAEFRSKAGIKCYIVRETNGRCCAWCSSLAGRYLYADAPDDIFRRHDNCTCTVTFVNGRERQDVWSKKKWKVYPILKVPYQPIKLKRNQAENLQKNQLAKYIGLDNLAESGIIKERPYKIVKSREKRLKIIQRGIKEERPVFSYDTDKNKFPSYSQKVPKKEGFYDVATHGADTFVDFFGENIDAYTLASIIRNRKDYIKGTNVRLLSCSTGNTDNTGNCFAQLLADELGVQVEAPTDILFVFPNGSYHVGVRADGIMKIFYPRK